MTTIKPATPLPWQRDDQIEPSARNVIARVDGIPISGQAFGPQGGNAAKDAAYIVAAANAYPELVADNARLREALVNITDAYERALKRFGAHEWGMLTVEQARAALAKVQS